MNYALIFTAAICLFQVNAAVTWAQSPAAATRVKEADEPFDFSDLDVPAGSAPSTNPKPGVPVETNDPLPANVKALLEKWERFQDAKTASDLAYVKSIREVASEMLFKRAATVDAANRQILMEEAKRIAALDPSKPVVAAVPVKNGSFSVLGTWLTKDGKSQWVFREDSKILADQRALADWFYVDEKNGVALMVWGHQHPNLIRVLGDRYESIDLYGPAAERFRDKATPFKPTPASALQIVTKLATDEKALADARNKLFKEKKVRISAFLRAQAQLAKGAAVASIMEELAALEDTPAVVSKDSIAGADRIAGTWEWHNGKKATLAKDGKVTIEGVGTGLWRAANNSAGAVAIVLHDRSGRIVESNQVLLGVFSRSTKGVVHLRDTSGKKYDIKKTGA